MDLSDALPSRLRPYVRDGRISVMPAKRAARLVLLDQVAQVFRAPWLSRPGRASDGPTPPVMSRERVSLLPQCVLRWSVGCRDRYRFAGGQL